MLPAHYPPLKPAKKMAGFLLTEILKTLMPISDTVQHTIVSVDPTKSTRQLLKIN